MGKKIRKRRKIKFHFPKLLIAIGVAVISLVLITIYVNSTKTKKNCANSISCISDLTGKYDSKLSKAEFMGNIISVPGKIGNNDKAVLGKSIASDKHIYVDLASQTLYAYEGKKLVYSFLVSTGKWGRTPTGDFKIWVKLKYTRMSGGDSSIGTYYNLPNVPYVMFFYNNEVSKGRGFSVHGAYWHNNFGHPMSHGCVNMRPEEAEKIYYWADPSTSGNITYASNIDEGTPITIYGKTPVE